LDAIIRQEVESLHEFFVGWFSGKLPKSEFDRAFLSRFEPGFVLISPAGVVDSLEDLVAALLAGHGSKPDLRISIHDVKVWQVFEESVLATYEERQDLGTALAQPGTARITTALFRRDEPLKWLHVHETWLPVSAGLDDSRESNGIDQRSDRPLRTDQG